MGDDHDRGDQGDPCRDSKKQCRRVADDGTDQLHRSVPFAATASRPPSISALWVSDTAV